jgi:hypothetical protein
MREPQDLHWTSFSNSIIGSVFPFRLSREVKNQINARMTATIRVSGRIKVNMAETVTVSMKTNLRYVIELY